MKVLNNYKNTYYPIGKSETTKKVIFYTKYSFDFLEIILHIV